MAHIYLSRFEGFNSSHGRDAGNDLLTEIAQRLQSHAGDVGMAARVSGARFALVMPKPHDRAEVSFEVRRLMRALVRPFRAGQTLHGPAIAVGVSLFPEDGGNEPRDAEKQQPRDGELSPG